MICATYLAVADPFTAALSAATEFGIAGEKAEKNSSGPGSFQIELFDQFYKLTEQDINSSQKVLFAK